MKTIQTNAAPAAIGPYSQAVISGSMVYTSGRNADPNNVHGIDTGKYK